MIEARTMAEKSMMDEHTAITTDLLRLQGNIRVALQRHGGIRGTEAHRVASEVLNLIAVSPVVRDEYREVWEVEMRRSYEKLVAKMEEETL